MSTFRDAIRSTVADNDNKNLSSRLLSEVADAIIAMPEMEAIKRHLSATWIGRDMPPDVPESVFDWVLEGQ